MVIITFFGHSALTVTEGLFERILQTIKAALKNENTKNILFYCGGYGAFDGACVRACRVIQKEYPFCEIVFVTPYITERQQRNIKEWISAKVYDSCLYPPLENVPPKFAICRRNEWMAEQADLIIAYVEASFGGAYKALQYAQRRGKRVVNLAKEANENMGF